MYISQVSGERLQDNWSSGTSCHSCEFVWLLYIIKRPLGKLNGCLLNTFYDSDAINVIGYDYIRSQ